MRRKIEGRLAKLEETARAATGRPCFIHSYREPADDAERAANVEADASAAAARLAGRTVVRFVHVAAPLGERAALARHE